MELFSVIYRTLFFYFFVTVSYRIMGKREVGQLGIIDLIVSILIAELVAISIENNNESMFLTIVPIIILVLLEIIFAYLSVKSNVFRTIIDGKPSIIICNGKINYSEMIKQRYTLDDLLIALRDKEIDNIDMVEYAFLEPNGKLSIFKYKPFKIKSSFPMPIILDGIVQHKTLKVIKKSDTWLKEELRKKELSIQDIFYAFYKNKKIYIIKKNEIL